MGDSSCDARKALARDRWRQSSALHSKSGHSRKASLSAARTPPDEPRGKGDKPAGDQGSRAAASSGSPDKPEKFLTRGAAISVASLRRVASWAQELNEQELERACQGVATRTVEKGT